MHIETRLSGRTNADDTAGNRGSDASSDAHGSAGSIAEDTAATGSNDGSWDKLVRESLIHLPTAMRLTDRDYS